MLIGIDASRYRHLRPTGVEVYSDEIIDGLLALSKKQKSHQLRLYTKKKLKGIPRKFQRILPYHRLWTQWHLSREMKNDPPDALLVPSHVLPRNHPKKSIIAIHDVAFREFPRAYSLFQYWYLHRTTKYAVKKAWKIIVPSTATQQDLQKYYGCAPQKIVLIPHGFRHHNIKVAPAEETKILKRFHLKKGDPFAFFVGRLETKKNLARLIEAFRSFRENHPKWRLILGGGRGVGFGQILKALEPEASMHVILPGYLTEAEKHVLMKYCRIFTLPSLSEGFGFPILEAAHYGKPILASNIPALSDFKDLIDVFVDPHDVNSIAEGLSSLSTKKTLPSKAQTVSRYSWAQTARQTWKLLTS